MREMKNEQKFNKQIIKYNAFSSALVSMMNNWSNTVFSEGKQMFADVNSNRFIVRENTSIIPFCI